MFSPKDDDSPVVPRDRHPIPLLPLRDTVVFPAHVFPLFVGRERSIAAIDSAMAGNREVFLAVQKRGEAYDHPSPNDLFTIGTVSVIRQWLRLADGTVKVMVEGKRRARIARFVQTDPFFVVDLEDVVETKAVGLEVRALVRSIRASFEAYVKLNKKIEPDVLTTVQTIEDEGRLADTILGHLFTIKISDRQALLETIDVSSRLSRLYEVLQSEIEILQVERKIRSRVKKQMARTQKEYYLNEQMHAIQKELGAEKDEFKNEIHELAQQLASKKMSEEASARVTKEIKKLQLMHPTSAEATVVRNYVDCILGLPWTETTAERFDLEEAERILDEDHYGLTKIKERILEHLAVQTLTQKLKGPILCFVGPPGVGKTSLARSIARATGRKYVRLSLGGVRDEAEIRGHRRTYIGALPGKIIQCLKKAGTNNPLLLLDEVDKMSTDFRGDPAAALLEVLDSEQNHAFNDHYLDLDYDLSDVMFITTANTLRGIPIPLQDRMEIIELGGYTDFEKLHIAQRYLLPRTRKDCGLDQVDLHVTDGAIRAVIHHYTQEAGVRALDREIASLCRKTARKIVKEGLVDRYEIEARSVPTLLGVPKFGLVKKEESNAIGLTNSLAVTSYGGDLLGCEVCVLPGKGKLSLTGLLEKGMEESAHAALSYVRSRASSLGLESDFYQKVDIHVHFPEFVPKDGPSAGVAMATSLVSSLLKVPVRSNLAMTGEITLRGRVLPIGGVKEKLLAAHRARIDTVVLPKDNQRDLHDVPRRVVRSLRIVLANHMDDVLREAIALDNPASVFGSRVGVGEYSDGDYVVRSDCDGSEGRSGS